eukprot:6284274-Prymnesium_polylepis.1
MGGGIKQHRPSPKCTTHVRVASPGSSGRHRRRHHDHHRRRRSPPPLRDFISLPGARARQSGR